MIMVMRLNGARLPNIEKIIEHALEPYSDKFTIEPSVNLDEDYFDKKREQYDAQKILYKLHELKQRSGWHRILGITQEDIFIEGMNYVFGLTSLSGGVCVVSLYRLINSDQRITKLERARITKEIIHEIGHINELQHCRTKYCVMSFSNSISEVDKKNAALCKKCKRILAARNY